MNIFIYIQTYIIHTHIYTLITKPKKRTSTDVMGYMTKLDVVGLCLKIGNLP